jgi:hypothetical protein
MFWQYKADSANLCCKTKKYILSCPQALDPAIKLEVMDHFKLLTYMSLTEYILLWNNITLCMIWHIYGHMCSDNVLYSGCTTIPSYQWTQVFCRYMLPPSSSLSPVDLHSMFLQNTDEQWQQNTMLWPRPQSDWMYSVLQKCTTLKEILKTGM